MAQLSRNNLDNQNNLQIFLQKLQTKIVKVAKSKIAKRLPLSEFPPE